MDRFDEDLFYDRFREVTDPYVNHKNGQLREILAKAGISRATVYKVRCGYQNISSITLYKICKLFNVSADYLLGLSDDKHG